MANELDEKEVDTTEEEETEEVDYDIDEEKGKTDTEEVEETAEEKAARLEKENETLKNQKEHWRKKATEGKPPVKPAAKPAETTADTALSSKDLYALMQANVPEDDIDEVVEYAKLKKISVSEALKTNVVKTILNDKAEERKVARATNTGPSKRGTVKLSEDALIDKANKGDLPDSEEEMARLVRARKGLK